MKAAKASNAKTTAAVKIRPRRSSLKYGFILSSLKKREVNVRFVLIAPDDAKDKPRPSTTKLKANESLLSLPNVMKEFRQIFRLNKFVL
jgi:hypothetical protein